MLDHPFPSLKIVDDHRWAGPTHECLCGNTMFYVCTVFDPDTRLPVFYQTSGWCPACQSLVRLPTPEDDTANNQPTAQELIEGPYEPVRLNLTCPQCQSDEYVVIREGADGDVAVCEFVTCGPIEWDPMQGNDRQV